MLKRVLRLTEDIAVVSLLMTSAFAAQILVNRTHRQRRQRVELT